MDENHGVQHRHTHLTFYDATAIQCFREASIPPLHLMIQRGFEGEPLDSWMMKASIYLCALASTHPSPRRHHLEVITK